MELKPWMINGNMWASGIKANGWQVSEGWAHMNWLCERRTEKWNQYQLAYFDFTRAIEMQKDTGWH